MLHLQPPPGGQVPRELSRHRQGRLDRRDGKSRPAALRAAPGRVLPRRALPAPPEAHPPPQAPRLGAGPRKAAGPLLYVYLKLSAYRLERPLSDTFGAASQEILEGYLTLEEIVAAPIEELAAVVKEHSRGRVADPEEVA